jgi:hypothetical protein
MVDVFPLWVIEGKDVIRGLTGPQIQPSFKIWTRGRDGGTSAPPSQAELPSILFWRR